MTRLFRHLVFGLCFLATSFVSAAGQNQPPVLGPIGPQSVDENIPLGFAVSATDAESTPVLTTSTLPGGVVFTDNGDGTGSFAWTPDFTQSGTYFITFFATDDSLAVDLETVEITVVEVGNQLPVLDPIGPHTVTEGVS
ncbi:MAG: Ig-like domain-containing protein, partial [Candidatus Zixiibacteriota bacterium]